MTIRTRTTPHTDIAEIEQALSDERLCAIAFADFVEAVSKYVIDERRDYFSATVLLNNLREQFEKAGQP